MTTTQIPRHPKITALFLFLLLSTLRVVQSLTRSDSAIGGFVRLVVPTDFGANEERFDESLHPDAGSSGGEAEQKMFYGHCTDKVGLKGWAKVGVMFRNTLDANSAFVDNMVTSSQGVNLMYRATAGGGPFFGGTLAGTTAPYWVRLTRVGNTFTGATPIDGITWTTLGSTTIAMNQTIYVGLAVTAVNTPKLNTATFDNVLVTQPTNVAIGGTASANPEGASGSTSAQAFDGNTATKWFESSSTLATLQYNFGTGVQWPVSRSATITVTNQNPLVATSTGASPSAVLVDGTSTILSVPAVDDAGPNNLTYTWSTVGTPPAPATFSTNANNAASNTTVTFAAPGTYNFLVTITDAGGATTTSTTSVIVDPSVTSIGLNPVATPLYAGASQQFAATAFDQFGNVLAAQPAFLWSILSGAGSVSSTGVYTAPLSATTAMIQVSAGDVTSSTSVTTISALLGDANLDGAVDLNDLNIVLNHLGSVTTAWTDGNFEARTHHRSHRPERCPK